VGLEAPRGLASGWFAADAASRRGEQPSRVNYAGSGMVIAPLKVPEVSDCRFGRVDSIDWLQGYGLRVVVEHGKGEHESLRL
jgi:septal ring factor EnvC (AmiA/AmiB activator)